MQAFVGTTLPLRVGGCLVPFGHRHARRRTSRRCRGVPKPIQRDPPTRRSPTPHGRRRRKREYSPRPSAAVAPRRPHEALTSKPRTPDARGGQSRPAQRRGPGRCTRERLSAGGVSTARAARARPHTHDIDETKAPGTTIACATTAPTISLGTSAPHIRPKDQSQCQQSDQTPL